MIRRVVHIVVSCDVCGDEFDRTDLGTVPYATAEIREAGWRVDGRRVTCPECLWVGKVRARDVKPGWKVQVPDATEPFQVAAVRLEDHPLAGATVYLTDGAGAAALLDPGEWVTVHP